MSGKYPTSTDPAADPDDDFPPPPPRRPLWPFALLLLVALGVLFLYLRVEQRGTSVGGTGHVLALEQAGTWAFLSDGVLLPVTAESAGRLALATGPCAELRGYLKGDEMHVLEAACAPGPLLRPFTDRLRLLGLKAAYWAEALAPAGDDPEPRLRTLELYASMVDPRFDAPQVLPLYRELLPGPLARARAQGGLPPPLIVQVKRNDFLSRRLVRSELHALLAPGRFSLLAAASRGGWLVRDLVLEPGAPDPVSRLLVAPREPPWPQALAAPTVRARPPSAQPRPPGGRRRRRAVPARIFRRPAALTPVAGDC